MSRSTDDDLTDPERRRYNKSNRSSMCWYGFVVVVVVVFLRKHVHGTLVKKTTVTTAVYFTLE